MYGVRVFIPFISYKYTRWYVYSYSCLCIDAVAEPCTHTIVCVNYTLWYLKICSHTFLVIILPILILIVLIMILRILLIIILFIRILFVVTLVTIIPLVLVPFTHRPLEPTAIIHISKFLSLTNYYDLADITFMPILWLFLNTKDFENFTIF